MSNITVYIVFLLLGTLIVSLLHYYFWRRLVKDTALNGLIRRLGTFSIILLASLFPISIAASSLLSFRQAFPIVWLAYLWLGSMLALFVLLVFKDLLSFQLYIVSKFTSL